MTRARLDSLSNTQLLALAASLWRRERESWNEQEQMAICELRAKVGRLIDKRMKECRHD